MTIEQFRASPFYLDDEGLDWVSSTLAGMSVEQKVAQLFVLNSTAIDQKELDLLTKLQPGGITKRFGSDRDAELAWMRRYAEASAIPPIVSGDLEGSRMSLPFGTEVINPLGLAAVDDLTASDEIGRILAVEGRAAGITWSFTPVVDINEAFRSAIVGTRSFGSDVDKIERHAMSQIRAFQANGVAATAKHWPGEGYDDRDQHLVTTINPLSLEDWEKTFGRLYGAAIDADVKSIMSAHIAFPALMRSIDPDCGVEAFRPASVNKVLNQTLLRERLGFNGLIVSDATGMAGLGSWCSMDDAMPLLVENGCDVILFSNAPERDIANVLAAAQSGRITPERLNDAVSRILALKAAQGLHKDKLVPDNAEDILSDHANRAVADAITARAPTLVKDVQSLLPLDPAKHKRVLIFSTGIVFPFLPDPLPFAFPQMLEAEGFDVTVFEKGDMPDPADFDLVLYIFGDENLLTRSHIFIDWLRLTGFFGTAMKRYWHDVPTAMISFGHPYYLYDAPRVPTYINAYSTLDSVQKAVIDGLLGRIEFNTSNPVDPFCGLEDARY